MDKCPSFIEAAKHLNVTLSSTMGTVNELSNVVPYMGPLLDNLTLCTCLKTQHTKFDYIWYNAMYL